MIYAILITVAAGLALITLLSGLGLLVFRGPGISIRGWRWRPNAIGFTVLALVVAAVAWRFFPGFIFLPLIIPFFWRMGGGRRRGPTVWTWRSGRRSPPTNGHAANGHTKDDHAIEGQYRSVDDE